MKQLALTALIVPLVLGSCSSTRYGDPKGVETVNIDWGSTDLQTFSEKMVKSLLEAPQLAYLNTSGKGDDKRIIAYMGGVRNDTSEHINLEAVTDSIRTELIRSSKFRFVADTKGQNEIGDQVRFQNEPRDGEEVRQAARRGRRALWDALLHREEEGAFDRVGRDEDRGRLLPVRVELREHRDRRDHLVGQGRHPEDPEDRNLRLSSRRKSLSSRAFQVSRDEVGRSLDRSLGTRGSS